MSLSVYIFTFPNFMSDHQTKRHSLKWALGLVIILLTSSLDASPSLTMSSNSLANFFEGQGSTLVDDAVAVSADAGGNLIDAARVIVYTNYSSANDAFTFVDDPTDNITIAFDVSIGVLNLDGMDTAGNYQAALRQVSFQSSAGANINKDVAMSLGTLLPFRGTDHTNFHFYEYVSGSGVTWIAADTAAKARFYQDTVQGYLMTLTTDPENTFALTKFQQNAWVGASDATVENIWRWVTGPEGDEDGGQGRHFYTQSGSGGTAELDGTGGGNLYYENWAGGEPNDWGSGEDYAHFWQNAGGLWNDFRVNNGSIAGYLVEYGTASDNIPFVGNVQTSYIANRPPQSISLSSDNISENLSAGTFIANVLAIEPDIADGHPTETLTLSLQSVVLYPDNASFSLNTMSNVLTSTLQFDREAQSTYTIGVTATDGSGQSISREFVINVDNVQEPPVYSTGLGFYQDDEDPGTLSFPIVVDDPETPSANLNFTFGSSDSSIVSTANMSLSGAGNVRTLNVTPTQNAYDSVGISLHLFVEDEGDSSGNNILSDNTTMTLIIRPVNDAPVHGAVADVVTTEDTLSNFMGAQALSFTDLDLGDVNNAEVTLQADVGSLSLLTPFGASISFSVGNGSSNSAMTFTGNATDLNAAMSNLTYTPPHNFFGTDNLHWTTSDQGFIGWFFLPVLTDQSTIQITMSPVNDRPILNVAGNLNFSSMLEDAIPASGNSWSEMKTTGPANVWEDVDTGSADSIAIVGAGNLNLGSWQFSTNGGGSWSDLPSVSTSNAYLLRSDARFRFYPLSNANGSANLIFRAWDESDGSLPGSFADTTAISNTGAYSSNTITLDQVIDAVNDAPIWTTPSSSGNTSEDTPIVQNPFLFNDIEFSNSDNAIISLTTAYGSANLATTSGLNFTTGDGTSDNLMVFEGNIQSINSALSSLLFIPEPNFNGTALISLSGNDQGLSGIGGALSSNASVIVLVNQVNDSPILNNFLDLDFGAKLEDSIDSSGNSVTEILTAMTGGQSAYSDIDESVPNTIPLPDGIAISTWSSANGQWQMTLNGGGSWNNFPTFTGDALLLGEQVGTAIRFIPSLHYFGNEFLSIRAWDGTTNVSGNTVAITGTGGTLAFSDNLATLTLPIQAINDAPFLSGPAGTIPLSEELPLSLGPSSNLVSLNDIEASSNSTALMELSLSSASGNLELASLTGISFQGGSSNAMSNVTIQGNLTDLTAAINGMLFRSHQDLIGSATLKFRLNDLDTTEPSPLEVSLSLNLSISNVNDVPVLSAMDLNLTYSENTILSLAANALVNDVDDIFIEGANVSINTNLMAQDRLGVTDSGNISSTYNNTTGELSLSGRDTLATYQSVIRTLNYSHLGEDPDDQGTKTSRNIQTLLYDGDGSSNPVSQTVSINSSNDSPVIASWDGSPSYTEGNSALTLDSDVQVSDGDSPNLSRLSILFTPSQTGDQLSITPGANLTLSTNTSGNLSYTGSFTATEASATLQSLAYLSTSEDPAILGTQPQRRIDVSVSDGTLSTNGLINLSVTSVNDAPTLSSSSNLNVDEDMLLSLGSGNTITLGDVDGNSGNDLQLTAIVDSGNLMLSGTTSTNLTITGSLSSLQSSLNGTSFLPAGNFFGNVSLNLFLDDMGNSGSGGSQSANLNLTISVNAINDAPLLQSSNRTLASVPEDATDPSGNTVLEGLTESGNFLASDADPGTSIGVAIVNQSSGSSDGDWQYSLDGTSSWFNFPMTTSNSALVLNNLAYIRFVPVANFNGTVALTYHAWDQSNNLTTGTNSIDASITGGDSAFSTTTGTWSYTVEAANDTPSVVPPGPLSLTEDTSLSLGGSNQIVLSDEDANSATNLQLTLNSSSGNIVRLGLLSNPLILTGSLSSLQSELDSLSFQPSGNANGSVALNITLNDMGNTGAGGSKQATSTISITLTPVNDAPTLTPFRLPLNDQNEDDTNPSGNNVLDLLSPGGSFSISDPDPGSVTGVVVTGTNTLSTHGHWEFSLNGGGSWSQMGTLSGNHALVLAGGAMIRFIPVADFNGGANLSFHAWDQSSGLTTGSSGVDASVTGGSSAFSDDSASWELQVLAINDPPLVSAPPAIMSNEDTSVTVSGFSISDPELSGTGSVQITVSAQDGVVSNGVGQTGSTFTVTDTLDSINTWLTSGLTFQPPADFNSVAGNITSIKVEVNDLGSTGLGGPLAASDTVSLYIGAINDAPILVSHLWTSAVNLSEDNTNHPGWSPGTFASNNLASLTDVDSAELSAGDNVFDAYGLAFTNLGNEVGGNWQMSLNHGGTWSMIPSLGNTALLLSLDGQHRLRFLPDADANGNINMSFRAWDRSTGVAGNLVSINATGGTSAFSTVEHPMTLAVLPINDAPTLATTTLPLLVDEDATLTLSHAIGNGLTPEDVDVTANENLNLSLTSTFGNLHLADLSDITLTSGANSSRFMAFTGNITALRSSLEGLRYQPDLNANGVDSLLVILDDGGQIGGGVLSTSSNLAILVQALNDDPFLDNLDGDITTFTENSVAFDFDDGSTLSLNDVDSADLNGGRIVIQGISGGSSNDRFSLVNTANVILAGTTLTYNGNTIAQWSDNSDEQASLTVNFSSTEASLAVVEEILQQIRFENDSDNPTSSTRSFDLELHDGDGGQARASFRIRVIPINDDPVLTATNLANPYVEDQGNWQPFSGNLTLTDPDSDDFIDGVWTVTAISGFNSDDSWSWNLPNSYAINSNQITWQGNALATVNSLNVGSTILELTFTGSDGNTSRAVEILEALTYTNNDQSPGSLERILTFSVSDGDGGVSQTLDHRFSLQAMNDAPILVMGTSLNLGSILEDTQNHVGWTATELLSLETGLVTELDESPTSGVLVRPDQNWNHAGTWETRLATGSWSTLPAHGVGSGTLLGPLDRIRFTPTLNWFGAINDGLEIWAWDRSQDFSGTTHSLSAQGGTSAYSLNSRKVDLTVTNVAEPPTISDNTLIGAKYAQRTSTWNDFSLNFNDVDVDDNGVGDVLEHVRFDRLPSNGNLSFNGATISIGQVVTQANIGLLIYTPHTSYIGFDNWAWSAFDGIFYSASSANMDINILPVSANLIFLSNDVNEDVGRVVAQVTLSHPSTETVKLDLEWSSGNLLPYGDFVFEDGFSIEIPAGVTVYGVNLLIIDDLLDEDDEVSSFTLANPSLVDLGTTIQSQLTVRDNDTDTGYLDSGDDLVVQWLDPPWVSENGDTARLAIRLATAPVNTVSVGLSLSDSTEASLSTSSFTFTPTNGTTRQIVTVTGVDDTLLDGPIDLAITLTSSDSNLSGRVLPLINRDNDTQGFVTLSPLDLVTSEDGAQSLILIQLQQAPTADVSLTPVLDTTQVGLSSTSLNFTASNWQQPQALILTGLDNSTQEGDRLLSLSWVPAVSTDSNASGLRPESFVILHRDNDLVVTGGGTNLPPYQLILTSSHLNPNTLQGVTLTFGAQDPEEVALLRGGIVNMDLVLGDKSAFRLHQHSSGSQIVLPFLEAGPVELELRAMDLMGAITTKKLNLIVSSSTTSPFLNEGQTITAQAPTTYSWSWKNLVFDTSLIQSIALDADGDGVIDQSGLAADSNTDTLSHTFNEGGQYSSQLSVILNSGERFSYSIRHLISSPSVSLPELMISSSLSSETAPATLSLQSQWVGVNPGVDRVLWNLGLDAEHALELVGDLNLSLPITHPGSLPIVATAILTDGRRVKSRHDVHLGTRAIPVLTSIDERLRPFQTTLGIGHPLFGETWPSQANTVSAQHLTGSSIANLENVDGIASVTADEFSSSMVHQLQAQLNFDNANWNLNLTREWQIDSSLLATEGAPETSDLFSALWNPRHISAVESFDGSGVRLPAQDLNNSVGTLTVKRLLDSGLNLQGVPLYLETLRRDIRVTAIGGTILEEPTGPVEILLAYDDVDQDGLVDGIGVSENELVCMRFDTSLNRWVPVEGFYTHPDKNVVRAKTYHLSAFGLFYSGGRNLGKENNSGGGCLLKP